MAAGINVLVMHVCGVFFVGVSLELFVISNLKGSIVAVVSLS